MTARTLFWIGNYDAARAEAEEAVTLARRAGDRVAEFFAVWQGAMTEMEAGRVAESIPRHAEALRLAEAANRSFAAMMRINLADAESQVGAVSAAEEQLAEARRDIAARIAPPLWAAYTDEIEARIRFTQARYDEAAVLFGRAAEASGSSWLTVRARLGRARALRAAGRPDEAAAAYRETILAVESTRGQASADQQRAPYMAANASAYRELVALLWSSSGPSAAKTAFAVAEAGRARSLLDALQATGTPGASAVPAPLERIQSALAGDELLLEFVEAEERLFVFAVARAGLRWLELDLMPLAELRERITFYRKLLREAGDNREVASAARALYRALLEPVLGGDLARTTGSLVVSADGMLHGLPLEALADRDAAGDPRFVGERFVVRYTPSGSLVASATAHRRAAGRPLLVVGDPPLSGSGVGHRGSPHLRSRVISRLPRAAEEASVAARHAGGAALLVGADASESAVLAQDPGSFRVLHFATHAVVDETLPLQSALWLGASPPADGLLQAAEIYHWSLQADLVVLSACDTGLGRSLGSEGLQSLARAFLHAKARSVVATLWEVEDAAALEMMSEFYARLAKGRPVAQALAEARRSLIARGWPPRAWAAFVAVAPVDVRPIEPRSLPVTASAATTASAAALAVTAGLILLRRRGRKP